MTIRGGGRPRDPHAQPMRYDDEHYAYEPAPADPRLPRGYGDGYGEYGYGDSGYGSGSNKITGTTKPRMSGNAHSANAPALARPLSVLRGAGR